MLSLTSESIYIALCISAVSPIATVMGLCIISIETGDISTLFPAIAMTEAALAAMPSIFHEHIVNLRRSNAVPAGRVYPDGYISAAGQQFLLEKLRCDVIVKPTFICDSAVEEQRSLRVLLLRFFVLYHLVRPLPEFLHRNPPFRCLPQRYLRQPT